MSDPCSLYPQKHTFIYVSDKSPPKCQDMSQRMLPQFVASPPSRAVDGPKGPMSDRIAAPASKATCIPHRRIPDSALICLA